MNKVQAYLFQHIMVVERVVMVWEECDVRMMKDASDYVLLATVIYDTEEKKIISLGIC